MSELDKELDKVKSMVEDQGCHLVTSDDQNVLVITGAAARAALEFLLREGILPGLHHEGDSKSC